VITKSTVPVGTAAKVRDAIARHTSRTVHVCSNPEFLKEGAAVQDFMKPDRVVVGVDSEYAREKLGELYAPFVRTGNPILFMDIASAEITKYAANAMLATRISFMNMIAGLCEAVGADVASVRQGVGTDERIGSSFLFAGIGYGGSCFPKDVKALIHTLKTLDVDSSILDGVERVNHLQKQVLLNRVIERFGEELGGRTFAVWGLSFKPETDDMREAPSLTIVRGLAERGARVVAHDPEAKHEAERHFGDLIESGALTLCERNFDCLSGADALLILTEWQPYRAPRSRRSASSSPTPVIFDGRNLWEPEKMKEEGFEYYSIGRLAAVPLLAGSTVAPAVEPLLGHGAREVGERVQRLRALRSRADPRIEQPGTHCHGPHRLRQRKRDVEGEPPPAVGLPRLREPAGVLPARVEAGKAEGAIHGSGLGRIRSVPAVRPLVRRDHADEASRGQGGGAEGLRRRAEGLAGPATVHPPLRIRATGERLTNGDRDERWREHHCGRVPRSAVQLPAVYRPVRGEPARTRITRADGPESRSAEHPLWNGAEAGAPAVRGPCIVQGAGMARAGAHGDETPGVGQADRTAAARDRHSGAGCTRLRRFRQTELLRVVAAPAVQPTGIRQRTRVGGAGAHFHEPH
jgi:UDPglucose 6-dehydrogenase